MSSLAHVDPLGVALFDTMAKGGAAVAGPKDPELTNR
jgi:hypothetical protein